MALINKNLQRKFNNAYDLNSGLVFFPIRHHSPACTHHLAATIEHYKPDAILIEGPFDTNHLIPDIGSKDTKAPLAIYYSYTYTEESEEGKKDKRYSCYYPMVDFSPELFAVRYGTENNIYTEFIDLPYSKQVREDTSDGRASYNDDYFVARSNYIKSLCEKQGCRTYSELWEKIFEINGIALTKEMFVKNMLAMCWFSRVDYPPGLMEQEGCTRREEFMASRITKAKEAYKRILVITGGFHTLVIMELLEKGIRKEFDLPESEAYLIPYSFQEIDQLAGYQSGMPHPAFYQQIHANIWKKGADTAYSDAVMNFIIKTGMSLRKKGTNISIPEEIAAHIQCEGLSALREKSQPGVYELLDGIKSTYVKGELNSVSSETMRTCIELLKDGPRGNITAKAEIVPLLKDFKDKIQEFGFTYGKKELRLNILSRAKDRRISIVLHRLKFLGVDFAKMLAGPDYRNLDTSRFQERWECELVSTVYARLVDVSYLGGTIKEACTNLINKNQDEELMPGSGFYTSLLIDVLVMNLPHFIDRLLELVKSSVVSDGSFESLGKAASNLMFLEQSKWLLDIKDISFYEEILNLVYIKSCSLLPFLRTVDEAEDRALARQILNLSQIARFGYIDGNIFNEALGEIAGHENAPPYLHGTVTGLLYSMKNMEIEQVLHKTSSYLFGSGEMLKKSGRFLGGLFYSAWDIIFHHNDFVKGLSEIFKNLDAESFMNILPDLRLAFSTFTPSNIHKIAQKVAALSGVSADEIKEAGVTEEIYQLGTELDEYAATKLSETGLI